jgi:hypothetical protein
MDSWSQVHCEYESDLHKQGKYLSITVYQAGTNAVFYAK